LGIFLCQTSHFQQWADPANAMGIFPQELCRAVAGHACPGLPTLDHQEGVTACYLIRRHTDLLSGSTTLP
jgi:hypothetical protein